MDKELKINGMKLIKSKMGADSDKNNIWVMRTVKEVRVYFWMNLWKSYHEVGKGKETFKGCCVMNCLRLFSADGIS